MPDLYAFPHISRIYYLENSVMHAPIFMKLGMSKNFPMITKWYEALKNHPDFEV